MTTLIIKEMYAAQAEDSTLDNWEMLLNRAVERLEDEYKTACKSLAEVVREKEKRAAAKARDNGAPRTQEFEG